MTKPWKEKNEELRRYWKSHVDQWSESGLSQLEYCRKNDLIPHRFTYWKRKFKKLHFPVAFVQIPEPVPINMEGLKLNIGRGLQLEIPDGFSQATLERVLSTFNVL